MPALSVTNKLYGEIEDYIADAHEKQMRLLEGGLDTAEDIEGLPELTNIASDMWESGVGAVGGTEYRNSWQVTDRHATDYPIQAYIFEEGGKLMALASSEDPSQIGTVPLMFIQIDW